MKLVLGSLFVHISLRAVSGLVDLIANSILSCGGAV